MFATCIYLVCIYPPLFYVHSGFATYHLLVFFFNTVSLQKVLIHQNVFLKTVLWCFGIGIPAWSGDGVIIIVVYFVLSLFLNLIWTGFGALLCLKFYFFELDNWGIR